MEEKELTEVLNKERIALDKLLLLLDEQYRSIMKKDIFNLEALVDRINEANKEIAKIEINRRKIAGKGKMREIVAKLNNSKLEKEYFEIRKTINLVSKQKDTNELLIKQRLSYTNQLLNIINPRRDYKTYNSYGNLSR